MSLIKKYQVRIQEIKHPFTDVFTLTLAPVEGTFRYKPGQFLHLALDPYDPSRAWPESRCFSIQSAPDDPWIRLTFSVKGTFTQRMASSLAPGQQLWIKMPYGELFSGTFRKEHCVFLAGGTGVTPFLSLFTSKEFASYTNPWLYLGLRNPHYHIYKSEFARGKEINPALTMTIVYAESDGFMNIENIFNRHGSDSVYFLSGPPDMIKNFKAALLQRGLSEKQVRTDEWE